MDTNKISIDRLYQQALDAYKNGNGQQAIPLLSAIISEDPKNIKAWYGLATCLDDVEKKRYCLHRILGLNPDDEKARKLLEQLASGGNTGSPANSKTANKSQINGLKRKQWIIISILGILTVGLIGLFSYLLIDGNKPRSPTLVVFATTLQTYVTDVEMKFPDTWRDCKELCVNRLHIKNSIGLQNGSPVG